MSSNAPSKRDVTLPPKEKLLAAMKLVENTPEGADYLSKRAHEIVKQSKALNKTDELKSMAAQVLAAIDEYAEFVRLKQPSSDKIWAGDTSKNTDLQIMQKGIALQAMNDLMQKSVTAVRFDFAISAEGHFVRGYGSADKDAPPLAANYVESLDKLFNAWLAEKHEVTTENGNLFKTDGSGNTRKLSVKEVEELMADSAKEFQDYLHEKGSIELISQRREYPGETRLAELKQAAEKQLDKIDSVVEEHEEPSQGMQQ